jgi:hypothetical protein
MKQCDYLPFPGPKNTIDMCRYNNERFLPN